MCAQRPSRRKSGPYLAGRGQSGRRSRARPGAGLFDLDPARKASAGRRHAGLP